MMIAILAAGSRGDTQPYLALALALQKAGLPARVTAFENYGPFIRSLGLDFFPLKGDIAGIARSADAQIALRADNPLKLILSFRKLASLAYGLQEMFFEACVGADAIIYHPGAAIGFFLAQQFQIPSILAAPFPMAATSAYPALIFYDTIRLGKWFNLASHRAFEQIMWFASSASIRRFWKQKFGCLPASFSSPFSRQVTRRCPTIISCSDHVFPTPADWSEHVVNTGYWFLDEKETWSPPTALLDFIRRGPPPVYIGFGSIADSSKAAQTTEIALAALKRVGQRGILAGGWDGLRRPENLSSDIYFLESVPHSWLFPQMAAVVHHGGAGTTAAGLKAGVPAVVIPHTNDQFAWGRRVRELGVGSKPIPRRRLNAENLADALRAALAPECRAAAQELGRKIQSENGAEAAVQVVIKALEHSPR